MTEADKSAARRSLAWLALLCIPMFFVGLGSYDLDIKGEPREGLTAWAAIHQDFLLPVLNGERLPEKPLLFPWMVAAAMQVFGETSEWALRLPSALAGAGLVFAVYGIGRRLISERGGLLAASATACTFLVVKLARGARVDMLLTFFVVAAVLLFLIELQRTEADDAYRPPVLRVLAFWTCLALGTLTKGPLAIILVGLATLPLLLVRRRLAFVLRMRPLIGFLVLLVLPGAWYVHGLAAQGRAFGFRTFLMENVLMFFGAEGGGGHRHGPFYFVPDYFFFGLPWSVLLPAAVVWAVRRGRGAWRTEPMVLPLGWFAAMFVFFSIASGKRQDYLLPLMPAAALLVAGVAEAATAGNESARRWLLRSSWLLAGVGAVVLLLVVAVAVSPSSMLPAQLAERDGIDRVSDIGPRLGIAAAVVLGAVAVALFAIPIAVTRRSARVGIPLAAGALSLSFAVASTVFLPEVEADETYRPFADEILRRAGPDGVVRRQGDFEPQLLFYLNRVVSPIASRDELSAFLDEPGDAWVISNRFSWEKLPPSRRSRLELVTAWPRRGQSKDDESVLLKRLPANR